MYLKVFGILCISGFLSWTCTSKGRPILLRTDTDMLCNMMSLLYYLPYENQGGCMGFAQLHQCHKAVEKEAVYGLGVLFRFGF